MKLKTLKDILKDEIDCLSAPQLLKAEALKEINNLDELEYILGLMSEPEKRILIKYIKWKNNLTSEDLK